MITAALADKLFAFGALIGVVTRLYALSDTDTVWSRKSSVITVTTYPVTALLPLAVLGMWYSFAVTFLKFSIWLGIYLFRSPEEEDWIGRK